MKQTGIWLDKDKAYILSIENEKETFETVLSNIEHYNVVGGSGTRLKGGPQNVVQDSKYLEREKHQLRQYFDAIASKLNDVSALVIYGPAGTNEKLSKTLKNNNNYNAISSKIKAVIKADSMTENQIKALIRDYFVSH